MSKKLTWLEASLLLIPLLFLLHQIFLLSFSDDNAGGLIFVLIIMSYSSFFFSRRDNNYFVLTVVAYSVVAILGSLIMVAFSQMWMILLLIWALIYTKAFTSGLTKYGNESSQKIEEELKERKGLEKLLATPTQREDNTNHIIDMFVALVIIVILFFAYEHITDRYEQTHKHQEK